MWPFVCSTSAFITGVSEVCLDLVVDCDDERLALNLVVPREGELDVLLVASSLIAVTRVELSSSVRSVGAGDRRLISIVSSSTESALELRRLWAPMIVVERWDCQKRLTGQIVENHKSELSVA